MNKKILLTCFEPFGDVPSNPSLDAVAAVTPPRDIELSRLVLPVKWHDSFEILSKEWDAFSPDAVIMTGLAGGAAGIRVERVGLNICGAIKDNGGLYPDGQGEIPGEMKISKDDPDAFFSTFDHAKILSALGENGIKAAQSFSAGTYICNYVLYSALLKNNRENSGKCVGFVHVPYSYQVRAGVPFMDICDITRALEIALENCF